MVKKSKKIASVLFLGMSSDSWQAKYLRKKLQGRQLWFSKSYKTKKKEPFYDVDAISGYSFVHLDKKLLSKFNSLKLISTISTGIDHINIEYCKSKNITVCNAPDYGSVTVAEYTFALILAVSKNIKKSIFKVASGKFDFNGLTGFDLHGKTIGIIGTGKIGRNVIKIAKGFGMHVLAYDLIVQKQLENELGFKYVSLGRLLSASDIVTIHLHLLNSTKHIMNKQCFNMMKKHSIFINTARGGLIDTAALVHALESGHISGAGIDVLEDENIARARWSSKNLTSKQKQLVVLNKKLINMPNVVVTPHTAFNTDEANLRMLETAVNNIISFERGKPQNIFTAFSLAKKNSNDFGLTRTIHINKYSSRFNVKG